VLEWASLSANLSKGSKAKCDGHHKLLDSRLPLELQGVRGVRPQNALVTPDEVIEWVVQCRLLALGVFRCGAQTSNAMGGTADIDWSPAPIASDENAE